MMANNRMRQSDDAIVAPEATLLSGREVLAEATNKRGVECIEMKREISAEPPSGAMIMLN